MNLGLAVSATTRDGVPDSAVLLAAAAASGVDARLVDWRSTGWDRADAVLLHTPWDHTAHPQASTGWSAAVSSRMPVFNPYASIAGDVHESHLLDLVEDGVPLPRTRVLRAGRPVDDAEPDAAFGTSTVVVEPAVGAGGRRLSRLDRVADLRSCPPVGPDGRPLEDLVVQENEAMVMELELTGPDLFLRHSPGAARVLVEHVAGS